MRAFLIPFALIFLVAARVRSFLYERGFLRTYKVACRVMSIGNITAGGTGKTPITAEIAKLLMSHGQSVGLISRGYRGTYKGIQKVPGTGSDAKIYGDEPSWLAKELQVPVYVGRSKVEAAQELCQNERVDWILADDAFQHRRLQRDLDIVILDATEALQNYWPLPVGRAREALSALKRASLVILNKTNFISKQELLRLRSAISPLYPPQTPVVELEYACEDLLGLQKDGEWSAEILNELTVLLVSGLGRPQSFESLVKEKAKKIVGHLGFGDHHKYSDRDFRKIEDQAQKLKADAIVMTQKDATKLKVFNFSKPVFVTRLILGEEGLLNLDLQLSKIITRPIIK